MLETISLLNTLGRQLLDTPELKQQRKDLYDRFIGTFSGYNQQPKQEVQPMQQQQQQTYTPPTAEHNSQYMVDGRPTTMPNTYRQEPLVGDITPSPIADFVWDPAALENTRLFQNANGLWHTDNPLANAFLNIESHGGRADDGSSTGALGLYQFTRDIGRQYGLLTDKDRLDPYKNHQAFIQLTKDNAKILKNYGLAVTPFNLYAAHNIGPGNLNTLYKVIQGKPVGTKALNSLNTAIGLQRAKGVTDAKQYYDHFNRVVQNAWTRG